MPKTAWFFVGLAAAAVAWGEWTLIGSWPTPGPDPRGFEGWGTGWVVQDGAEPQVYRVDGINGSVYSSFAAPGGRGAWGISRGPAYNDFYLSNYASSWVYHLNSSGSVISSFLCALAGPGDVDYDYGLYIAFPDQNLIARVDVKTGSVISSWPGPGTRATAPLWINTFVADSATHTIYQYTTPIITGIETPVGLGGAMTPTPATGFTVIDDATDYAYRYGSGQAVTPASMGKVKALYR